MDGRDGLAGEGEGGVVEEGGCESSFKRSASLDMNPAVISESNAFGLVVVAAVVVVEVVGRDSVIAVTITSDDDDDDDDDDNMGEENNPVG